MEALQLDSHGASVRQLRDSLISLGLLKPNAGTDNQCYDHHVVRAVKQFQVQTGGLPDGVATPSIQELINSKQNSCRLDDALLHDSPSLAQATVHLRNVYQPTTVPYVLSRPAKHCTVSDQGLKFILGFERSISNFYVPTTGSGITVGVGYDMKLRNWGGQGGVKSHLAKAGITSNLALWQKAAELDGDYAAFKKFTDANDAVDMLDSKAAWNLLVVIVEEKAKVVQHIFGNVPLGQTQFDALVSRTYNGSTRLHAMQKKLHQSSPDVKAVAELLSGQTNITVDRRDAETKLFLYGDYGAPKQVPHARYHPPHKKHHAATIPIKR